MKNKQNFSVFCLFFSFSVRHLICILGKNGTENAVLSIYSNEILNVLGESLRSPPLEPALLCNENEFSCSKLANSGNASQSIIDDDLRAPALSDDENSIVHGIVNVNLQGK